MSWEQIKLVVEIFVQKWFRHFRSARKVRGGFSKLVLWFILFWESLCVQTCDTLQISMKWNILSGAVCQISSPAEQPHVLPLRLTFECVAVWGDDVQVWLRNKFLKWRYETSQPAERLSAQHSVTLETGEFVPECGSEPDLSVLFPASCAAVPAFTVQTNKSNGWLEETV